MTFMQIMNEFQLSKNHKIVTDKDYKYSKNVFGICSSQQGQYYKQKQDRNFSILKRTKYLNRALIYSINIL